MTKLICLKSTDNSCRFYSTCSNEKELTMNVGDIINYPSGVSYEILGFVDNIDDHEAARRILYPSEVDEQIAIANYIHNMAQILYQ